MRANTIVSGLVIFCILLSVQVLAQSARVARWSDNAKAAYSIDIDDYPWTDIAPHHAEFSSRGLVGTFACIAKYCGTSEWNYLNSMISYGHEVANHTWDHLRNATDWNSTTQYLDVDSAQNTFETHLGVRPYWYVYVSDVYNSSTNSYIRSKGYVGACGGAQGEYTNSSTINPYNISDGIEAGFCCMDDGLTQSTQITRFNGLVDASISAGGWGIRMMHGIDDNDWGEVTETAFTTHLDYVVQKINNGDLWNETCSNVMRYVKERETADLTVSATSDTMRISFDMGSLDADVYDYPLTILAKLPSAFSDVTVVQGGGSISFSEMTNDTIKFDADPNGAAVLIVNGTPATPEAPQITSHPSDETVDEGGSASFSAAASGYPTPSYQWLKDGSVISGATSSTYNISSASFSDSGAAYSCIAINTEGRDTSNTAVLHVTPLSPPEITEDPTDQTVDIGQRATFNVTATGDGTLSYQWQKDGVDVNGAESDQYRFRDPEFSDSGSVFRCIVSSAAGSDTSAEAVLHVNPASPGYVKVDAGAVSKTFVCQTPSSVFLNVSVAQSDFADAVPVRVSVYNIYGQEVRNLLDRRMRPGAYRMQWDMKDSRNMKAPNGFYLFRIRMGEKVVSRKIALVR